MKKMPRSVSLLALSLCVLATLACSVRAQAGPQALQGAKPAGKAAPRTPSPDEELQQAISSAANDRAALLRNLEGYLAKYPDSPQRPQIYRTLVEASLQLRDNA